MSGVSSLTGVLLLPVFTRVFEVVEYGALDILVTLSTLLGLLPRLGLPSAFARYYHEQEDERGRQALVTTLMAAVSAAAIVTLAMIWLGSSLLANILLDDPQRAPLVTLAASASMITAIAAVPMINLRMRRRIVAFNLLHMLSAVVHAATALTLVLLLEFGIAGVLLGSAAGATAQFLGVMWTSRSSLRRALSGSELRRSLKYGLPIMPSVVMGWVNRQADRFVLLAFLGLGAVGVYGAAARVGNAVVLLTMFFRQAWQPYAMSLVKEPAAVRNEFYRRVLNLYLVGFSVAAVLVVATAREIFGIFVGAEYLPGYVILPWLIGAGVLRVAGDIAVMGVLVSERTYPIPVAAWTGVTLNLLLAVALIPTLGIVGAAVGHFVAELAYVAILWAYSVQRSGMGLGAARMGVLLGCYVAVSLTLLLVADRIADPGMSLALRLGVAGAFVGVSVLYCVEPASRQSLRSGIRSLQGKLRLPPMRS